MGNKNYHFFYTHTHTHTHHIFGKLFFFYILTCTWRNKSAAVSDSIFEPILIVFPFPTEYETKKINSVILIKPYYVSMFFIHNYICSTNFSLTWNNHYNIQTAELKPILEISLSSHSCFISWWYKKTLSKISPKRFKS